MRTKSTIQLPVYPTNPTTPSQGNIVLFPKSDGIYYLDESGTATKIGADGSNVGGVESQEVMNRLERLENQQRRVSVEHTYALNSMSNISSLDKIAVTSDGSELLKSENCFIDEFDDDSSIDLSISMNVTVDSGAVRLDNTSNIYTNGSFTTLPIEVEPTDNITLKASEILPHTYGSDISEIASTQWIAVAKDPNERVWIFTADHTTYSSDIKFYYTIYNKDGSVFKETDSFSSGTTKYALMFGSSITFDSLGRTNLTCMARDTKTPYGYHWGYDSTHGTGSAPTATTGYGFGNGGLIFRFVFDSSGNLVSTDRYLRYTAPGCRGLGLPDIPELLFSSKGYAVRNNGGTAYMYSLTASFDAVVKTNFQLFLVNSDGELSEQTTFGGSGSNTNSTSTFHTGIFKHEDDIYLIESDPAVFSASTRASGLRLRKVKMTGNVLSVVSVCTIPSTYAPYRVCGGLNTWHYNSVDKHLYLFSSSSSDLTVAKYEILDTGLNLIKTSNIKLVGTVYSRNTPFAGGRAKFIDDGDMMHISFLCKGDGNAPSSLHYICIDTECRVVTNDFLVSAYDSKHINDFYMILSDNHMYFFYGYGTVTSSGNSDNAYWNSQPTSIDYQVLNINTGVWHDIENGQTITLDSETDKVKLRAFLKSPQYGTTPMVERMVLEYTPVDGKHNTSGEVTSARVSAVSSTGRGTLNADYDLNDGSINWFISYDGGVTWRNIDLGVDFTYSYVNAPDFRVKAVISIPDYTAKSPVIRSFTLRTDSVVLHSDIEELQINLMKTNFKIDSYTNAVKNDLLKMSIDVFSDTSHIDLINSDFVYDTTAKTVGGVELVSLPDVTSNKLGCVLLTSDEILPNADSYIEYFASKDGGITFYPLTVDVVTNIPSGTNDTNTLILKALFHNGARLNAWAWAWN